MKKLLGGLFALTLAACASTVSFTQPYQEAVEITNNGNDHCSGVMVDQDATTVTVLTAGHCVEGRNITSLKIITENWGNMNVSKMFYNRDATDVGVIIAEKVKNVNVDTAKIASSIVLGEAVVTVGFPGKTSKTISFGFVSNLFNTYNGIKYSIFQLAGGPGDSGSGIFNSNGEVVGVLTGPATNGFGFIRGSTIEDIKAILNEAKK